LSRPGNELVVELRGQVVLVGLVGEHDVATAEETLDLLRGLAAVGSGGVVVDVTETVFLDLSAARMLLRLERELRAVGRRLVIAGGQQAIVRIVLTLSGAARRLDCVAAIEDAVSLAHTPSSHWTKARVRRRFR
jgi:anti-anti-sigma factor